MRPIPNQQRAPAPGSARPVRVAPSTAAVAITSLVVATALALLLASLPEAQAKTVEKPPKFKDVTVTRVAPQTEPGADPTTFILDCPSDTTPVWIVTEARRAEAQGGFMPSNSIPGLAALGLLDATSAGVGVFNTTAGPVEIRITFRCVRRKTGGKVGRVGFVAKLLPPDEDPETFAETVGVAPGERLDATVEGGRKLVPVGSTVSPAAVSAGFSIYEYVRSLTFSRSGFSVTLANPGSLLQSFALQPIFLRRKANVKRKGRGGREVVDRATVARKLKAKPSVLRRTKTSKVKSHGSTGKTQTVSARCPKSHLVTGWGWDARDAGSVDVTLRSAPEFWKRKVSFEASNSGGSAHRMALTAICLAVKVRG